MPERSHSLTVVLLSLTVWTALTGCAQRGRVSLAPLPSPECNPEEVSFRIVMGGAATERRADEMQRQWAHEGFRPWKYIVIHHSATEAGSAEIFDRRHRARGFDELGYHFVINNGKGAADGRIESARRWRLQKWGAHTGGTPGNEYNNYGIGICLVGDFTERLPSERQLGSLRMLVGGLMAEFSISPASMIGHRDAPNASTACPGDKLHGYLRGMFSGQVSSRTKKE